MSADDARSRQRQRLCCGHDLLDRNAFVDHRPGRDEAGPIFDASDTDALEMTGVGSGADSMARPDHGHLPRHLVMRLYELGYHRLFKCCGCACRHIGLLIGYRDDQPVPEIRILCRDGDGQKRI